MFEKSKYILWENSDGDMHMTVNISKEGNLFIRFDNWKTDFDYHVRLPLEFVKGLQKILNDFYKE